MAPKIRKSRNFVPLNLLTWRNRTLSQGNPDTRLALRLFSHSQQLPVPIFSTFPDLPRITAPWTTFLLSELEQHLYSQPEHSVVVDLSDNDETPELKYSTGFYYI